MNGIESEVVVVGDKWDDSAKKTDCVSLMLFGHQQLQKPAGVQRKGAIKDPLYWTVDHQTAAALSARWVRGTGQDADVLKSHRGKEGGGGGGTADGTSVFQKQ